MEWIKLLKHIPATQRVLSSFKGAHPNKDGKLEGSAASAIVHFSTASIASYGSTSTVSTAHTH